ncbi:hypothetical protein D3C73_933560 [compost metagenome]
MGIYFIDFGEKLLHHGQHYPGDLSLQRRLVAEVVQLCSDHVFWGQDATNEDLLSQLSIRQHLVQVGCVSDVTSGSIRDFVEIARSGHVCTVAIVLASVCFQSVHTTAHQLTNNSSGQRTFLEQRHLFEAPLLTI